jgi:acyl dehydratase
VAQVGATAPAQVFEVTAENITQYCRAAGYENVTYTNQAAAREAGLPGVVAPQAMLFSYAPLRTIELMAAPTCRGGVAPQATPQNPEPLPFVRTAIDFQGVMVVPGDVISSVTSVHDQLQREGERFITFRVVAHNQRGELVAEYLYTCQWSNLKAK